MMYARVVFEIEVEDDASDEEIEEQMHDHISGYLGDTYLTVSDMEFSDTPYTKD